jgi:LPS export ABC transporter protein LptC
MGRKLTIAAFLICFALALGVYLTREQKMLRQSIQDQGDRDPRIVMEDFIVFRYAGDVLKARVMARLGHFYEPNVVELDGEIRGERVSGDGFETLGAESATAYFNATSLSKMMSDAQLDRAELAGFVEVGTKEHLLTTDYAEYINATKMVRSVRPVRVEGPNRVFNGDDGFSYSVDDQTLEMFGLVKGVMTLEEGL